MMREILFLAHRAPWPADRGDKIRSFHLLQKLRSLAPVHVAAFADDQRDLDCAEREWAGLASLHVELRAKPQWLAGIEALASGKPVSLTSFASKSLQRWIDERLGSGKISHVFVFSGQMAQYVPDDYTGRVIMDFVDVDSAKFESYAGEGNALMRWIHQREGEKLAGYEAQVAARANACLFVSEAEAALFRARSGTGNVHAIGNGIDTGFYDPAAPFKKLHPPFPDPLIVFTGQMDYRPNIEAVTDFAHNAFPAIRSAHPGTTFAIVGRNPAPAVAQLSALPGVQVTGAVDDVRPWIAGADVVVAPLRIARGVQNKVLEAMAMAKPVVASTAAAEGIMAEDGIHYRIAGSAADEARIVCELLADTDRRVALGQAARAHVVKNYGWGMPLAALETLL